MSRLFKLFCGSLILSVVLNSCVKDNSFENGFAPNPNGTNFTGCKSCHYQPWCTGSAYTFIDSAANGISTTTANLSIIADTTIGTDVYSKTTFAGNLYYHNCTNDVTTIIMYNVPGAGSSTISRIKNTILRANSNVGATWSDVNDGGNGVVTTSNYQIISMGTLRTVLGVDYSDVIQVHQSISANVPVIGNTNISTGDFYYAKGIGLIESLTKDPNSGLTILHRKLESYLIP